MRPNPPTAPCPLRQSSLVGRTLRLLVSWALTLGAALTTLAAEAEAAPRLVEEHLMCPVLGVTRTEDGGLLLRIGRGEEHGLVKGSTGNIVGRGEKTGIGPVIGRAEVVEVTRSEAVARVIPESVAVPAQARDAFQLELRALIPIDVHRGPLFSLYQRNIMFLDNDRQPLWTLDVASAKDDALEKAVLAKMVDAGRKVVDQTHQLPQIQTRTRWKGKTITEIMSQNDERDYLEFLRFTFDYSASYSGTPLKINEAYATWLTNYSPPAASDRFEDLRAASHKAFVEDAKKLTEPEFNALFDWAQKSIDDMPLARLDEARAITRVFDRLLLARGGPTKAGPLWLAKTHELRARFFHREPKALSDALDEYRKASQAYLAEGSDDSNLKGIVCLNNTMSLLVGLNRDDEVLALLPTIRRAIAERLPMTKSPMYAPHLEAAEVFPSLQAARVLSRRGQHRELIALLQPLVERFASAGFVGARARTAELLETIANAHIRLGELAEAEALHQRVADIAHETGDLERTASIAWTVGNTYYTRGRYEEAADRFARSAVVAERAGLAKAHAKALAAEGQALWKLGRLKDALARHDAAMALREQLGDKSGTAWQLTEVGRIQVETGDREAARKSFGRALALYTELGTKDSQASVRIELGKLEQSLRRAAEAEREFAAAHEIYKALKWPDDEAYVLQEMAIARRGRGDEKGAEQLLIASIRLLEKTGAKQALAGSKLWHAQIQANDVKRRKSARALLEQLMPKDRAADPGLTIDVLLALSDLDGKEGDPTRGLARAEEALALAERNQDTPRTLRALGGVRWIYGLLGDLAREEEVLSRSLELAKKVGNRPSMAWALQQLAWLQANTGRLSEAKKNAEEAVALARQNDDPNAMGWAMNALSKVYKGYNDTRRELELLDEALQLVSASHDRYGRAAIIFNRALTHARLRELERALEGYKEAELAWGDTLTAEIEVALPNAKGASLALLGRTAEAEKQLVTALSRARTRSPARVPDLLITLSRLESDRGRHAEALAHVEEALALLASRKGAVDHAEAALGRALSAAGRFDEARAALERSIARTRQTGAALGWEPLFWLAKLESRRNERKAAIALLEEAAREIEKAELVLSEDSVARTDAHKVEVFRLLVKLLLADGRAESAFQYLERSKVAELRDLDRRLGTGDDENATLAIELDVQEKRLRQLLDEEYAKATPNATRVKQLDELISAARIRRAQFIEGLARKGEAFDSFALRPIDLTKLQQNLGEGMLVVAPVALDDSVVVFVLTKDVLTHFSANLGAAEIDKLVVDFVRELNPKGLTPIKVKAALPRIKAQAQRLYDLLVRPAIEAVGLPKTLVLSPTGALRYLPFAALHDGEKWLVERTALLNVSALDREKFVQPAPNRDAEVSVVAMVDPDGSLPNAHFEVAEIQKALSQVEVLEGKDANASSLKQKVRHPGYDVLHFATHGRLDAKNPELSHLVLADQPLTYRDIEGLDPKKTQLIVLSACQTAVSSGGTGVEIAGLAQKFMLGPVSSVMATLWQVDDRASSELMGHFYHELRAGKRFVDALAAAQRRLLAEPSTEHPGFWSGFVMMGSP